MTFLYGTNMELLYSMPAIGVTQSSSVATVLNTAATSPPFQLPALANIWSPSSLTGKGLLFVAGGGYSTATNTLTTLRLSLDSAVGTTATNTVAATGALAAAGLAASAGAWELQCWMTCVGISGETSSSWYATGQLQFASSSSATAASFAFGNTISNGTPQTTVIPIQAAYYTDLVAQWQISPGAMICSQFMVFGLD